MKRAAPVWVSRKRGFTLVEVLLALAIAAIGFGVVLHSVGLQLTLVGNSLDRHQMLLYASQALEQSLAAGTFGDEEVGEQSIGAYDDEEQGDLKVARYFYSIDAQPVTADPRIQQVSVTVRGDDGLLRLSAYTLRIQRESQE